MKRFFSALMILLLMLAMLAACGDDEDDMVNEDTPASEPQTLRLATTTSTEDSGLLAVILPDFEEKYNAAVEVIAVGTGQALQLGTNGDVDVVLVHARAREDAFVEAGDGTQRYDVMYNDFVILGPEDDPAGIRGMTDAAAAFLHISEAEAVTFISRGDDSGTHTKEKAIWTAAGIEPTTDWGWYLSVGQGMGEVLNMTNEIGGYTLADRGTYLSRMGDDFAPVVLVEGDPLLANPYGVIPVNPDKHEAINAELAQQFVDWLISVETQQMIADYQINGQPLFFPDSEPYHEAQSE